eukprot:421833-Ditylum_brightwellii.AAC.1
MDQSFSQLSATVECSLVMEAENKSCAMMSLSMALQARRQQVGEVSFSCQDTYVPQKKLLSLPNTRGFGTEEQFAGAL